MISCKNAILFTINIVQYKYTNKIKELREMGGGIPGGEKVKPRGRGWGKEEGRVGMGWSAPGMVS
jgi:hypothetical protein